jgi:hypothetical protein
MKGFLEEGNNEVPEFFEVGVVGRVSFHRPVVVLLLEVLPVLEKVFVHLGFQGGLFAAVYPTRLHQLGKAQSQTRVDHRIRDNFDAERKGVPLLETVDGLKIISGGQSR